MPSFYYFAAGPRAEDRARRGDIADLMHRYGAGNNRLAIPPVSFGHGCTAGSPVTSTRCSSDYGTWTRDQVGGRGCADEGLASCMRAGCKAMQEALVPGITENALWAKLHETNIRLGGEWIETRLLSSGPRTNPWFRECSMRQVEAGDMISFDTDLIGPYGYCADISRAWVCGREPNDEQRRLYATAFLRSNTTCPF